MKEEPNGGRRAIAKIRSEPHEQQLIHQEISPKIGDSQRALTSSNPAAVGVLAAAHLGMVPSTSSEILQTPLTKGATPDLSPASSHSSGYGSLRSIAECSNNPPEIPARLPAGSCSPRKNGFIPMKGGAPLNRSAGIKSSTVTLKSPIMDSDDNIPPPPPPPRNPIPRMVAGCSRIPSRGPPISLTAPIPAPLIKSSSQVTEYLFFYSLLQPASSPGLFKPRCH